MTTTGPSMKAFLAKMIHHQVKVNPSAFHRDFTQKKSLKFIEQMNINRFMSHKRTCEL